MKVTCRARQSGFYPMFEVVVLQELLPQETQTSHGLLQAHALAQSHNRR